METDKLMNAVNNWVPLFQTLIWVILIIVLIAVFWNNINVVLNAFVQRVIAGAAFTIGPLNIGTPPASVGNARGRATATAEGTSGADTSKDVEQMLIDRKYPPGFTEAIYLVHASQIVSPRTERKNGVYRVRVWLEAYQTESLDEIKRVSYRLHDTFGAKKLITTRSRLKDFELWLNVYGEFTIVAYVEREKESELWLSRYLDLPGRPPE